MIKLGGKRSYIGQPDPIETRFTDEADDEESFERMRWIADWSRSH